MLLHLGGGALMPLRHIVAILDLDAAQGTASQPFLQGHPMPPNARSAVVTHWRGITRVYPSTISALTLMRRCQQGRDYAKE